MTAMPAAATSSPLSQPHADSGNNPAQVPCESSSPRPRWRPRCHPVPSSSCPLRSLRLRVNIPGQFIHRHRRVNGLCGRQAFVFAAIRKEQVFSIESRRLGGRVEAKVPSLELAVSASRLKETQVNALGLALCQVEHGLDQERRRWRFTPRSWRRRIFPIVLHAGGASTACFFSSTSCSFFGPRVRGSRRPARISFSMASAVRRGKWCGQRVSRLRRNAPGACMPSSG